MLKKLVVTTLLILVSTNLSFAMDEETQKEIQKIIKNTMLTKYATVYDAKNKANKYVAEKFNPTIQKCRYNCEGEFSRNRAKANNYSIFRSTEDINKEAQDTAKTCFVECSKIQNEANEYYQYIINYLEKNYNLAPSTDVMQK